MQFPRLVLPTTLTAVGFFLLTQGFDSLKVEHLGIRLLTVQWFAHVTTLSYHTVGIICVALGFALMFLGAEICRRADKRVVTAIPAGRGTTLLPTDSTAMPPPAKTDVHGHAILHANFRWVGVPSRSSVFVARSFLRVQASGFHSTDVPISAIGRLDFAPKTK